MGRPGQEHTEAAGESRDPLAMGKVLWVQPWLLGQRVVPEGLGSVLVGEAAAWAAVTNALLPYQTSRAPGCKGTLVPSGRNGDVPHCQQSLPLPQRIFPQDWTSAGTSHLQSVNQAGQLNAAALGS